MLQQWLKMVRHRRFAGFFCPALISSAAVGVAMLVGCTSRMTPALPALSAAHRHTPTFAAVARTLSHFPIRCRHTLFATLKLHHRQISMIGRLDIISATDFKLTAADEFGRLLFLVRRRSAHATKVQAGTGVPDQLAADIAQDVVIALLPPRHLSPRSVWRVLPHFHAVRLSYTDELKNIHHDLFTGRQGYLRYADITLTNHQHLQVRYTRYNAAGCPRTLWIRQRHEEWLLILDFTGSHG